jgi:hypothetical protein
MLRSTVRVCPGLRRRDKIRVRRTELMKVFLNERTGGLAQLARAPALHAGGQEFESLILHKKKRIID